MKNPFGWHYPPGCSEADIERAFGDGRKRRKDNDADEFDPDNSREDLEERRELAKAYERLIKD